MSAPATTAPSARVALATDADADRLAAFYRRVWDAGSTADAVRAARTRAARLNPAAPGETPPTHLFLSEDAVVGHVTTIGAPLRLGDRTVAGRWLKGLMVLPEHRKGPVGYLVLREAVAEPGCAMAMVVQPEVVRLYGALGFRALGVMEDRVKPLDAAAIVRRLAGIDAAREALPRWMGGLLRVARHEPAASLVGAAVRAALAARVGLSRIRRVPATVAVETPAAGEIDRLWARVAPRLAAAPVRDAAALRAHYDGGRHLTIALRRRGELAGIAIMQAPAESADPRLNGIRVAVLSDMLCDPADAEGVRALVRGAEGSARDLGAHLLLCGATHESLLAALRARGFLRAGARVHVLFRGDDAAPAELERWWLLRGDGAADDAF